MGRKDKIEAGKEWLAGITGTALSGTAVMEKGNMEHIRNMDDRNGKDTGTDIRAWEQLNEQGMEAYFQPIYNVSEKRLTGHNE